MIQIQTTHAYLIGDCLSTVPFMAYLCGKHQTEAVVSGEFNSLVAAILGPSYHFRFDEDPSVYQFEAVYSLSVAALFDLCSQVHMCQSFFKTENLPVPELPLELDLLAKPCDLPPGLVISPYSRSNMPDNNKLWPHERWLEVVQTLRNMGIADRVYVVGASGYDDPTLYIAAGVEPVFDRPLAMVLDLIRQAPMFLSIDNGISHLAHYGGVGRHVLLYPGCLPECWVRNPRAAIVRAPMPIDIQPAAIINAALQMFEPV